MLCISAQTPPPPADPTLAVVRITSHGATGTIIKSEPGKSLILSCGHMIDGASFVFQLDARPQTTAPDKKSKVRLAKLDTELDLSLLEIDNGPFATIPVAPTGYKPETAYGIGYPSMKWPGVVTEATITSTDKYYTYTREQPQKGTSGGPLISGGYLIGVVHGYETVGDKRGMYVSHQAIMKFLNGPDVNPACPTCPIQPKRSKS